MMLSQEKNGILFIYNDSRDHLLVLQSVNWLGQT